MVSEELHRKKNSRAKPKHKMYQVLFADVRNKKNKIQPDYLYLSLSSRQMILQERHEEALVKQIFKEDPQLDADLPKICQIDHGH